MAIPARLDLRARAARHPPEGNRRCYSATARTGADFETADRGVNDDE